MKMEEKVDKILVSVIKMEGNVERNTQDLAHHIKRTNLIEGKLQKIIYLLWLGAGIGVALYGPQAFKLIGLL